MRVNSHRAFGPNQLLAVAPLRMVWMDPSFSICASLRSAFDSMKPSGRRDYLPLLFKSSEWRRLPIHAKKKAEIAGRKKIFLICQD
jgi:hypothetical protein